MINLVFGIVLFLTIIYFRSVDKCVDNIYRKQLEMALTIKELEEKIKMLSENRSDETCDTL